MATVNDYTTAAYGGNYGIPIDGLGSVVSVKKRYVNTASSNLASGEYYRLQAVAANQMVRVSIITETVEGAGDTVDVSFVATSDTTAASPVSIVSNHDLNTDDAINTATIFTDADGDICVKPDAALGTCKFWIVVEAITLATTD